MLIETIWKRYRNTLWGRFVAGFLIGGVFGVPATLGVSHDAVIVAIWSGVSALIGGFASLFLELRDCRRSATPRWKNRIERTSAEIRAIYPDVPPLLVKEVAIAHEQKQFTPLVWVGMTIGILCALCGVLVFILKIVDLFR